MPNGFAKVRPTFREEAGKKRGGGKHTIIRERACAREREREIEREIERVRETDRERGRKRKREQERGGAYSIQAE